MAFSLILIMPLPSIGDLNFRSDKAIAAAHHDTLLKQLPLVATYREIVSEESQSLLNSAMKSAAGISSDSNKKSNAASPALLAGFKTYAGK